MSTLGMQITNIEDFFDQPEDDNGPYCPDCGLTMQPVPVSGDEPTWMCVEPNCDNLGWFVVTPEGLLHKIAPQF